MDQNDATLVLKSSAENIFNDSMEGVIWTDENNNPIKNIGQYLQEKHNYNVKEALKKYSPIGTIVSLQERIGRYMIIGYKCQNKNIVFDYLAVRYPEGTTGNLQTHCFNHDEIMKVHHIGMCDGIQKVYKEKLLKEDDMVYEKP